MFSVNILFSTTTGHTEYVVDTLIDFLKEKRKDLVLSKRRIEQASTEELLKGDVLILAAGTWNTGGVEGQLSPLMHAFLKEYAKETSLKDMPATFIALGDDRYRYTARAGEHMQEFIINHHGKMLLPGLRIVNEPYGQESRIQTWGEELLSALKSLQPEPH